MRCYPQQHPVYCGIDLHARTRYLGILDQAGATLWHRHMTATPEALRKAIAPSRAQIVLAAACMGTWYWLADLCAAQGIPCVLGHALDRKAIHGGKATHEKSDAHTIAVLRRGGMRPQAYGSPAAMRATRALLRRRLPLARQRGARLAHGHKTHRQSHLPAIGTKSASKAHRDGVVERLAAPAVPTSLAGALARIGSSDALLRAIELPLVQTAKPHDAHPRSLRHTVPGIGTILRLVLLSEMHAIARVPRGQDCAASGRLVQWAQASAGTRSGTSGSTSGQAHLTWTFADAAVFGLRDNPAAPT